MNTLDTERAIVLLKAAHYLLNKCNNSGYVLSCISEVPIPYDETECDGLCLMEDIEYLLEDAGINISEEN